MSSYSEVINSLLAHLQGYDDIEFGDNESTKDGRQKGLPSMKTAAL